LRYALEKQDPVREAREHIVVRQVIQPLLLLDVIYREGDVAGELSQQLHLALMEELDFISVQSDHAHHDAADYQRERGH
jgi:hypothetical protein